MALDGPTTQHAPTARHEFEVLLVLSAGTFLFFNSYGSITVTLPSIQDDLGHSLAAIQWVSTMGLVMSSSLAIGLGRTSDTVGRRGLYKLGVTLYALGAALSGVAQSFSQLVGFRIIMTLGLAMAMPLASAILISESRVARRGWMLGLLLSAGAVGRTTGPTLGGIFLALWGWRAVFFANACIGGVVSLAVWAVLGKDEKRRWEPINVRSALALVVGYPALLVGLSLGASSNWNSPLLALWFLVGALGMLGFVVSEMRSKNPLIPIPLVQNPPLSMGLLALMLFSIAYFPILVLSPLYLKNVLALSPLNVGLLLTTLPAVAALCSLISGRFADRTEPWKVTVTGLALGAGGVLAYASLGVASAPVEALLSLGLVGAGIGFVLPANQKSIFNASSREHYGVIGGMLAVCGPGAGALGIGIAVALVEGIGGGVSVGNAAVFVTGQRMAMLTLLSLPLIALGLTLRVYWARRHGSMGPDGG